MGAATKSGNDERIQNLQGRQERQQQLDAPVQLRELSCLRNARIFLRGYSELRQYGSWLHPVSSHCFVVDAPPRFDFLSGVRADVIEL